MFAQPSGAWSNATMGTHAIERIRAVRDAVDRIEFTVRVATDFFGTPLHAFALHCDCVAAFYREPVPPLTMLGPSAPRVTLPTRWTNRAQSARMHVQEVRLE